TILSKDYPFKCISEWARTNFSVDLKLSDIADVKVKEIEQLIKRQAKGNAANNISLSMGEYLEDYGNPRTWDIAGLS
ncbi:unnamed protein product, partial [marine sediment metagenome]